MSPYIFAPAKTHHVVASLGPTYRAHRHTCSTPACKCRHKLGFGSPYPLSSFDNVGVEGHRVRPPFCLIGCFSPVNSASVSLLCCAIHACRVAVALGLVRGSLVSSIQRRARVYEPMVAVSVWRLQSHGLPLASLKTFSHISLVTGTAYRNLRERLDPPMPRNSASPLSAWAFPANRLDSCVTNSASLSAQSPPMR